LKDKEEGGKGKCGCGSKRMKKKRHNDMRMSLDMVFGVTFC
jgi:hypothetical protein